MRIGVVFPQTEIGADPGAVRAYAEHVEELGFTHLLAYDQGPHKLFEPFLITMEDEAERFPVFQHPGTEFIHMLKGVIEYRHGQHTYILHPGDTLHVPG